MNILSPKLFISYSHQDNKIVKRLVSVLKKDGFKVFLDASDIDPGDNFVSKLSNEINQSTAIIPIISKKYSLSRWAQAELYQALTTNKIVIPVLISGGTISSLDDPLQRLLRDRQYVTISDEMSDKEIVNYLAGLLKSTRTKNRQELFFKKIVPYSFRLMLLAFVIWWIVGNLNYIKTSNNRIKVISEIKEAKNIIQEEKIVSLAASIKGDQNALGEIVMLSNDLSKPDVTRINAIAISNKILNEQKFYRWYINELDINHSVFENFNLFKTSFLGGHWSSLNFFNSVFANVFWGNDNNKSLTMAGTKFVNSQFLGSEIANINAIDVVFENCKFLGSTVDTSNFSKTKFITKGPETEGNPIITPYQTVFEKSLIISNREKPEENVLDLTLVGDTITFDSVLFIDCKLEGWFDPEWFRESNFINCELPESLDRESLEKAGNIVIHN